MNKKQSKKKSKSASKAAKLIANTLWQFLEKLPKKERHRRLDEAHRRIKAKTSRKKRSSSGSDTDRTNDGRLPSAQVPYAARSGR
jgi:hypothetical protein